MKKLFYFSLGIVVISVGLFSMQQRGQMPQAGPMIALVSSDGQTFNLPQAAVELSPTLKTILTGLMEERKTLRIAFSQINGETFSIIVNILASLYEKVAAQQLKSYLDVTIPKNEIIKYSLGRGDSKYEGYVTQNLQGIVDSFMPSSSALNVMLAFDFLQIPELINAACKWVVKADLEKNPGQTLPTFMAGLQRLIPESLFSCAEKHYLMQKARITTELSIADYIALNGMPKIQIIENLKTIILGSKSITSLDGIEQLPELNEVQALELNYNKLTSLAPGVFQGFTSLQFLELDHNELDSLVPGVFQELTSLESLWLNHNYLISLAVGVFRGLPRLQRLGLKRNHLTSLEPGVFQGLTNLQFLWLNHNQLTSLAPGVFQGLTNLQSLLVNNNFLQGTQEEFKQQHALGNVFITWGQQN